MFENFQVEAALIPSDPRFGSGPSLVPREFTKKLADLGSEYLGRSHRKPVVKNIVKEIQEGLTHYFDLPKDSIVSLGNGGATCLFDMLHLGMTEKTSLHYVCGEFSTKWYKAAAKIPWIEASEISAAYGEGFKPENNPSADTVCLTLNETSTGVQNSFFPKVGADSLLCIDATSGGGQIKCDVGQTDVFFFSPQKVFASEGGLWVAILSKKAVARIEKIMKDKSRYIPDFMNWKFVLDNAPKNQTYTTPSLTSLFFLNEQIKLMNKLGSDKVYDLAEKKANLLYSWAEEKKYLSPYVAAPEHRSRTVATINVDESIPVDGLIKRLEELKVAYDIASYRKLGKNQFRIGFFHNVTYEDCEKLTQILSTGIEGVL